MLEPINQSVDSLPLVIVSPFLFRGSKLRNSAGEKLKESGGGGGQT